MRIHVCIHLVVRACSWQIRRLSFLLIYISLLTFFTSSETGKPCCLNSFICHLKMLLPVERQTFRPFEGSTSHSSSTATAAAATSATHSTLIILLLPLSVRTLTAALPYYCSWKLKERFESEPTKLEIPAVWNNSAVIYCRLVKIWTQFKPAMNIVSSWTGDISFQRLTANIFLN